LELDPEGGFIIATGPASKAGTYVIAARVPLPHRAAESHANARLIVQAVNAYDALVDVAQRCAAFQASQGWLEQTPGGGYLLRDARAALALVGGADEPKEK
jgi:hypothetical protein